MFDLRITPLLLMALAACMGGSLSTARVATAATNRSYLFSTISAVSGGAHAVALSGVEWCTDTGEGHGEYQLVLTVPQVTKIQSAFAAGVRVRVWWSTERSFYFEGTSRVQEVTTPRPPVGPCTPATTRRSIRRRAIRGS